MTLAQPCHGPRRLLLTGALPLIAAGWISTALLPYTPAGAAPAMEASGARCNLAGNTLEIINCQGRELARLNSTLRRYLA
ncbi:MAG: hypothetical protein WCF98_12990, partial [Synechococcus sp. ELA057]